MLSVYVPLITLGVLALAFAIFSVTLATIVGPSRYNKAKYDPYECGIEPVQQPTGGGRFPIKYYLVAMTFIVFDVEVMFLVPWAIAFSELAMYGLIAALAFIAIITVPFAYEWRRGALEWD